MTETFDMADWFRELVARPYLTVELSSSVKVFHEIYTQVEATYANRTWELIVEFVAVLEGAEKICSRSEESN